jgi:hypothetical protein
MGVLAGEVIGVFAHVESAGEHRAGRRHAADEKGVSRGRRIVAIDPGAGARRHPSDVEEVLDRIGHAGERQRLARRHLCVHRIGLGERPLERRVGEGAEPAVGRRDMGDRAFRHRARRHSAPVHRRGDFVRGFEMDVGCHAATLAVLAVFRSFPRRREPR